MYPCVVVAKTIFACRVSKHVGYAKMTPVRNVIQPVIHAMKKCVAIVIITYVNTAEFQCATLVKINTIVY